VTAIVSIDALGQLREKYRRMLSMRRDHDSGVEHDPRQQMRELAIQFPGALRELDELPLATIESRIDQLGAVIEQPASPAPWMLWMVEYHGHLRAALRVKRFGLPLHDLDRALAQLRRAYVAAIDEPSVETFASHEALAAVLKPVGGRLSGWAFARIAERYGVEADEVRTALFPARRPQR